MAAKGTSTSSRHSGASTYRRPTGGARTQNGAQELLRPRFPVVGPLALLHRVEAGDRLDLLAARYFGDPFQYWRIADANPSLSPDELLEPGRVLRIPRVG